MTDPYVVMRLPLHPRPKLRPRVTRGKDGRIHVYCESDPDEYALRDLMRLKYRGEPLDEPLIVTIIASLLKGKTVTREYPAVKPDCDNLGKLVADAGNKIIWKDDAQIVRMTIEKEYSDSPGWLLTVSAME